MAFNKTGFISSALAEGYSQDEINKYLDGKLSKTSEPETLGIIDVDFEEPKKNTSKVNIESSPEIISDNSAIFSSVGRGLATAGASREFIVNLLKKIPFSKVAALSKFIAEKGVKLAGPILQGLMAAAEAGYDAKSGKTKQTGDYWTDAGLAGASYLDSVLFNLPEGATKLLGGTPFWENNVNDRAAIQKNNRAIKNKKKNVANRHSDEGLSEKETQAMVNAVAKYISARRKKNPEYTQDDFYNDFTYVPSLKKFIPNKK